MKEKDREVYEYDPKRVCTCALGDNVDGWNGRQLSLWSAAVGQSAGGCLTVVMVTPCSTPRYAHREKDLVLPKIIVFGVCTASIRWRQTTANAVFRVGKVCPRKNRSEGSTALRSNTIR